jgi:hypothetical protein
MTFNWILRTDVSVAVTVGTVVRGGFRGGSEQVSFHELKRFFTDLFRFYGHLNVLISGNSIQIK